MDRTILHINIIHFYVSIASLQAPKLLGYPVAIAAPGTRRTLLDISSEAWKAGVSRGMNYDAAKRLCPDLVLLEPAPSLYEKIEKALFDQTCHLSPLVERAGPGHLFVDLTGTQRLLGTSADVADKLRKNIKERCRIEPIVGIAANRLVSKIATRVIKPRGLCSVVPGGEEDFMAPLPLTYLPGIDMRQLELLLQFNLQHIRDLTRIPVDMLATALGPAAFTLNRLARGIDQTPVHASDQPLPSLQESITLHEQTNDETLLGAALFRIVAKTSAAARAMGLAIGKVRLSLRYADGAVTHRSGVLKPPLNGDLSLYEKCSLLLKRGFTRRVRLTDLAIDCTDLTFPYGQMDLFMQNDREEHLMSALDTIRRSFGKQAIQFWGRERMA